MQPNEIARELVLTIRNEMLAGSDQHRITAVLRLRGYAPGSKMIEGLCLVFCIMHSPFLQILFPSISYVS